MKSTLRPTGSEDESRLREFLAHAFGRTTDAAFLEPALLRWKYWERRDDCPEPRSLVLERDGEWRAHVGLWPVTVESGGRRRRGVQMIDWAADPRFPGAGISLLQRLTKQYDLVYSIGGSEATRAALPRFGFDEIGRAATLARPLRPWRQIAAHSKRDLKLPVRLARNLWWAATPRKPAPADWFLSRARPADASALPGGRDAGFFEYLERCPGIRFLGFDLLRGGEKRGLLALAIQRLQARVAGIWLERAEDWTDAFALAQSAAREHAVEIVARCGSPASLAGARAAGLRERKSVPVFVWRRDASPDPLPLDFQLCDDDAFFLASYTDGFLT